VLQVAPTIAEEEEAMSGTFSVEESAVGVLLAVMCADGRIADEEMAWWKRVQDRHPLFADLPASLYNPMVARAREELSTRPWREAIADWAAQIPPQHARTLFTLAVELAFIDRDVSGQEPDVLVHLWHGLGIPEAEAKQILSQAIQQAVHGN
jgi:hypothetical protein